MPAENPPRHDGGAASSAFEDASLLDLDAFDFDASLPDLLADAAVPDLVPDAAAPFPLGDYAEKGAFLASTSVVRNEV